MTHTPGPWAHESTRYGTVFRVYDTHGRSVAKTAFWLSGHSESLANARLIAAAPDLLLALREISEYWNGSSGRPAADASEHAIKVADAAIAKVTDSTYDDR